jgi:hypothetical protein
MLPFLAKRFARLIVLKRFRAIYQLFTTVAASFHLTKDRIQQRWQTGIITEIPAK